MEVRTTDLPQTDWNDTRRRQQRTEDLIDRLRDAQRRLDKAIERATEKR
jgi:hypothetical protein